MTIVGWMLAPASRHDNLNERTDMRTGTMAHFEAIDNASFAELIRMLSYKDEHYRAMSDRRLVNMGSQAIWALPALLALHMDSSYFVRIQVVRAIMHLGPRLSDVKEIVEKLLRDEDSLVASYARRALRAATERENAHPSPEVS